MRLISSTLLTRRSASVLQVVCPAGCEAYKRRLAYSVTVRISAQNNIMLLFKTFYHCSVPYAYGAYETPLMYIVSS